MKIPKTLPLCLALIFFLPESLSADDRREPAATIRAAVEDFLKGRLAEKDGDYEIDVAMPDRRLRVPRCGERLEVFVQSGGIDQGALSLGVRCQAPSPWTLYTTAQVRRFREVVVLTRPVQKGALITDRDVTLRREDVSRLRQGYLAATEEAIGRQVKRALPAGARLREGVLASPRLVRRGQTVAIVARSPTLDVRMSGKALMDGVMGQRIRVRNERSKRIVEGRVVAPGVVSVIF